MVHDSSSEEDEMVYNRIVQLLQQSMAQQSVTNLRQIHMGGPTHCDSANVVHSWLTGDPCVIFEQTILRKRTFVLLCNILVEGGYYVECSQTNVGLEESLGMFLYMMASDQRIRHICNQFNYSKETVMRQTTNVLEALYKFSTNIIAPRNDETVHPRIRQNSKLYPYFKDCVGAIDGTHISASVPISEQDAYRNRHSDISQNVMAACDHDMWFVFVYAGWEGSAHDALVFERAINDPDLGFLMPSNGKYYVVDSAYKNMPSFLVPFRGHRYHLSEFSDRSGEYRNLHELFNHRHLSLRNVIERVFGVLKQRFPFLRGPMRNFKIEKQAKFVIACCVVHNLIRETDPGDAYFDELNDVNIHERYIQETDSRVQWRCVDQTREGIANWNAFRLSIAEDIWNSSSTTS